MSDMMDLINAWINTRVSGQVRYLEISEQLTDADMLALADAWTPAYGELFTRINEDLQSQMEQHPLGEAYDKAVRAAMDAKATPHAADEDEDAPAMDVRNRAWRLFRAEDPRGGLGATRREYFEAVADGISFAMAFGDMIAPADIEPLKAPWRQALGHKFNID